MWRFRIDFSVWNECKRSFVIFQMCSSSNWLIINDFSSLKYIWANIIRLPLKINHRKCKQPHDDFMSTIFNPKLFGRTSQLGPCIAWFVRQTVLYIRDKVFLKLNHSNFVSLRILKACNSGVFKKLWNFKLCKGISIGYHIIKTIKNICNAVD